MLALMTNECSVLARLHDLDQLDPIGIQGVFSIIIKCFKTHVTCGKRYSLLINGHFLIIHIVFPSLEPTLEQGVGDRWGWHDQNLSGKLNNT